MTEEEDAVLTDDDESFLTEEEETAILWHNGLYGQFKYDIPGKETKLYMVLHWADMWASRVTEIKEEDAE